MSNDNLSERDVERLTRALTEHRLHASMNYCLVCHWRPTAGAGSLADQHAVHVTTEVLAPVVAAIRDEAKAEAWDEGERAGRGGGPGHGIIPNPYRALLDGGEK